MKRSLFSHFKSLIIVVLAFLTMQASAQLPLPDAPSQRATFTVTNLDASGVGSLRQAMLDANANAEADTITFQAGLSGTILLLGPLPTVTTDMSIVGLGADIITISGNKKVRIFDVDSGADLTLSGLKLINGKANMGGAIRVQNSSTLSLSNSILNANKATFGGAIALETNIQATISNSTLTNNTAIGGTGGAIYIRNGIVNISNSLLDGNTANVAGALTIGGGIVTLTNSTISNNTSLYHGGAFQTSVATLNVISSTIDNNRAATEGGAYYAENFSAATFTNTTFTSNHAGKLGGVMVADSYDAGWDIAFVNSTLIGNSAGTSGGGIYRRSRLVTLRNTIVALNTAPSSPDVFGQITSLGYNLIGNKSGANIPAVAGDMFGTSASPINPKLGPLADNGGSTKTRIPASDSPAINAIPSSGAGICGGFSIGLDQRGIARAQEFNCDIGAVEVVAFPPQNDLFASAQIINGNAHYDSQLKIHLANINVDDPDHTCRVGGADTGSNGVWYRFTPSMNASLDIDTIGSSGSADNTLLSVFTGDVGSFSSIACSDDISGSNLQSGLIDIPLTSGTTYSIFISRWDMTPASTIGKLNVNFTFSDGGTERLFNGGFEIDSNVDNKPDGWVFKSVSGDKMSCNPSESQSGNCAFLLKGSSTEKFKLEQVVNLTDVTFNIGDTLTLSGYFIGEKAAAKAVMLVKVKYVGTLTVETVKVNVGQNVSYSQITAPTLTLTNPAVEKITVTIYHTSKLGKMFFDTASLLHIPAAPRSRDGNAVLPPPPAIPDSFRGAGLN